MTRVLLIILLIFTFSISYAQRGSANLACRRNWQYSVTNSNIEGRLIYFLPVADCGYSISESLSIIKTDKGDTIRVLNLCDVRKKILPDSHVKLLANKEVTTKASIIPIDKIGDCIVKKTFYGKLLIE